MRLDIWVIVGIAVASALAVSGVTYLALKPSTEVNKAKEARNIGHVVKRLDTVCLELKI
ncbi:hypothetical protein [Wolbachia pipientis]|uniref:hypothetical protein n=1 Tax=Wolbachia pipientis TaxID=955 RepID=UPI0025A37D9F|nr:hypothetical protein [Wolbachia pipientis]MDM8334947.1 hypothetical protein [Wolbachia pipientis]